MVLSDIIFKRLGIMNGRIRQHTDEDLAHYAKDCWDYETCFDGLGWIEIAGFADRDRFDMTNHKLATINDVPIVYEASYGMDRLIYSVLHHFCWLPAARSSDQLGSHLLAYTMCARRDIVALLCGLRYLCSV